MWAKLKQTNKQTNKQTGGLGEKYTAITPVLSTAILGVEEESK